eukprot:115102_1
MAQSLDETEGLDMNTFLQKHNLSDLSAKFEEVSFTIDALTNCTEADIRELCAEFKLSVLIRMKLITAVKTLPNAKINEPSKQIIFLGAKEKTIMDKLYKKNEVIAGNMKQVQLALDELEKSSMVCTKEVHNKYNNMVSILDKYRKSLLDNITNLKNKRKHELEQYLNQLKLLNDVSTKLSKECHQVASKADISSSLKLQKK